MQRTTGFVRARRPGQPLDSVFALRVYDRRGLELAGVKVRWTPLSTAQGSAGAALTIVNAVTDSMGLSRVVFTPGRTADGQGVVAEVDQVGRLEFVVRVPVHSISVLAGERELWAGDERIVSAELRDVDGTALTGGRASWATTDTSVIEVVPVDSLRAAVRGRLAGEADIVTWTDSIRDRARISVRPTLLGRFSTADSGPVPTVRVLIRAGDRRDTVAVSAGSFQSRIDLLLKPDLELIAMPTDTAAYHVARIRLMAPRDLQHLDVALIPTRWRIDAGTYAGQEVPVDATRALRRNAESAGFWRVAPVSGRAPRRLLGWDEREFPLRLAFARERSAERVAGEDSVTFWATVEQMHRDLGARLFVPAELRAGAHPADIIPVEVRGGPGEGHTFLTWSDAGTAYDGVVTFRRAETLRNPQIVTHELLHLLGFGHTSEWPTVADAASGAVARLTPQDVAYVQLAMRLRRLQSRTGARPGLPLAQP